ncbi:MAG TPA: hypothetical protein P5562_01005 [Candidatus Woesebacteria bacterium]|nr:hypothetical protein [Candidatus Woesebacteria bacterium]
MYKNYNFKPKSLSPQRNFDLSDYAEKIIPFLIITATFIWLWK